MQQEILVVSADPVVLSGRVMALRREGYAAAACSSFPDARRMLDDGPTPDLLVTDVRLGPYNGLHLVAVARVEYPRTAAVVIGAADHVLEVEASGLGARYVVAPVSPQELVSVVAESLMVPKPRRRWPRKRLLGEVPAIVGGLPARVLDVSYGGLGLEVFSSEIPADHVEVVLPDFGVGVQTDRVWLHRPDPAQPMAVGLALPADDTGWQRFVDNLQVDVLLN
jgi:CheY-like chemotaxis protein